MRKDRKEQSRRNKYSKKENKKNRRGTPSSPSDSSPSDSSNDSTNSDESNSSEDYRHSRRSLRRKSLTEFKPLNELFRKVVETALRNSSYPYQRIHHGFSIRMSYKNSYETYGLRNRDGCVDMDTVRIETTQEIEGPNGFKYF